MSARNYRTFDGGRPQAAPTYGKKVETMSITLIHPAPDSGWAGQRLDGILRQALAGREVQVVRRAEELSGLEGRRLLLALALGDAGVNLEYVRMLARLRKEPELLRGCTGGLIVDGAGELYTKSAAAEAALALNRAGCALVGRPLVEATGSLVNFTVQAKNLGTDLTGAYRAAVQELADRVETGFFPRRDRPQGMPPEPPRKDRPKDSTEQASLMKPYYLDIGR